MENKKNVVLHPFVKWAGGKSQLLSAIQVAYPKELGKSITKYAEPFVGGGAVLFDILSNYSLKEVYVSDINKELVNAYMIIRDDVEKLIGILEDIQSEYLSKCIDSRKQYYYEKREHYNNLKMSSGKLTSIEKAALFIFLNKTCFNGLYRVNRNNLFNVPMGKYKNPCICDKENLNNVSKALKNITIISGDYQLSGNFIDENTLAYFDPPYRPLNKTASFTSYTSSSFNDKSQVELSEFINTMSNKGAKIIASNSDPKNTDDRDEFFEKLYGSFNIKRVQATRMINCMGNSRGKIKELLITNY